MDRCCCHRGPTERAGLVCGAQIEVRKVLREGAVGINNAAENRLARRHTGWLGASGVTPFIDLHADQVGARDVSNDLGFKQATE